jgi:hypothetical protein
MRHGVRFELIRFGLLIVLTIGLASVAFRVNSTSSAHSSRVTPPSGVTASPTPSTTTPATPSAVPSAVPSSTSAGAGSTGAGSSGGAGNGSASGTGTTTGAVTQLPRTGWDNAIRLGGVGFVLLVAGALSVGAAGKRDLSAPQ